MQSSVACAFCGALRAPAPGDPNATSNANTTVNATTPRTRRILGDTRVTAPHPGRVNRFIGLEPTLRAGRYLMSLSAGSASYAQRVWIRSP